MTCAQRQTTSQTRSPEGLQLQWQASAIWSTLTQFPNSGLVRLRWKKLPQRARGTKQAPTNWPLFSLSLSLFPCFPFSKIFSPNSNRIFFLSYYEKLAYQGSISLVMTQPDLENENWTRVCVHTRTSWLWEKTHLSAVLSFGQPSILFGKGLPIWTSDGRGPSRWQGPLWFEYTKTAQCFQGPLGRCIFEKKKKTS